MRRKALTIFMAAVAAISVLAAVSAQGEATSNAISTKLDLAYVSRYVWRGLVLNPDPAFQPSLTFSHPSGVSLNIWGSMDTTDAGEQIGYGDKSGSLTEIDYTLNYAWSGEKLSYNAGVIGYTFPHTGFDSTVEVYGSVCFGGMLSPALSVNYDVDAVDGFYASLNLSYACPFPVRKTADTLNFGARISYANGRYNSFYFGEDKAAFTDVLFSAGVPFTLTDKLSISPTVCYSMVLDHDLRDAVSKPDNFVAGLTLSYVF